MIIQLPPTFENSVKYISVVVPILSKSIMNHNRMKLVWSLFIFYIWLFTLFFKCINFDFEILQFSFCAFSILTENSLCYFNFCIGDTQSILMKLVDIKMSKLLTIHHNWALKCFMIFLWVLGNKFLTILEFLNDNDFSDIFLTCSEKNLIFITLENPHPSR